MNFLRNLLAAILGTFISLGLLFFLFIAIIVASASSEAFSGGGILPTIHSNSILALQIQKPIVDHVASKNQWEQALGIEPAAYGLDALIRAIEVAENDDRIEGISIQFPFLSAGFSQTQSLRRALKNFKKSGKFIFAYHEFFTQKDYYFASVADSLFLHPQGEIDFKGLASEILYFKDFEEKSGVSMEVIRHGKYKSAVEPFLQNKMSDENRTQIKELLWSLWKTVTTDIEQSGLLDKKSLNKIASQLAGRNSESALESGLVHQLVERDEYEAVLRNKVGIAEDDDLHLVSIQDYLSSLPSSINLKTQNKIAVIYAQGEIVYGEGNKETIGQEIMIEALEEIQNDDRIKAVVLRINSPGGSALASELILRKLTKTKNTKPLVVSMGDVAASGGYYIACMGDEIIAESSTITGSIGVFGALPNARGLANKWGINAEQVTTHPNALGYSIFEPLSESFKKVTTESIENVYNTFVKRVATGRGLTVGQVHKIAQGRVWSGMDAKKIGLVDDLGGLDKALERAAALADIENFNITAYPKFEDDFQSIINELQNGPLGHIFEPKIYSDIQSTLLPLLTAMERFSNQEGIQARLPFELIIK
jgi:protease-4